MSSDEETAVELKGSTFMTFNSGNLVNRLARIALPSKVGGGEADVEASA